MRTKLAQSYDIENIMNFVKDTTLNPGAIVSEEALHEYKATILEYIQRREAVIKLNGNNKIVGFTLGVAQ